MVVLFRFNTLAGSRGLCDLEIDELSAPPRAGEIVHLDGLRWFRVISVCYAMNTIDRPFHERAIVMCNEEKGPD